MNSLASEMVTVKQVARLLGFSPMTTKKILENVKSEIPPLNFTKRCLYRRRDVERWIEKQRQGQPDNGKG